MTGRAIPSRAAPPATEQSDRTALKAALARSIDNTLFFAAEATDTAGHDGTVHGAIASGRRAAQEILEPFAEVERKPAATDNAVYTPYRLDRYRS